MLRDSRRLPAIATTITVLYPASFASGSPWAIRAVISGAILVLASMATADDLLGWPRVVDGDGLILGAVRIRLHGIDAPELDQICTGQQDVAVACGQMARNALVGLIGDQQVRCEPETRDRYGRTVAVCLARDLDLGREMVRLGWARTYLRYSDRYLPQEIDARAAGRGLWGGSWDPPAEWRRTRRD